MATAAAGERAGVAVSLYCIVLETKLVNVQRHGTPQDAHGIAALPGARCSSTLIHSVIRRLVT